MRVIEHFFKVNVFYVGIPAQAHLLAFGQVLHLVDLPCQVLAVCRRKPYRFGAEVVPLDRLLVHLLLGYSYSSPVGLIGSSYIANFLFTFLTVNLSLAFFNLIPLPPLDGSKVVLFFLSGEARARYYRLEQYAMPILIIALYVLPSLLRFDPVGIYLDWTAGGLYDLLLTGL